MTDDHQYDPLALPYEPPRLPDLSALAFGGGSDLSEHFRHLDEISRRRTDQEAPASDLLLPECAGVPVEDSLDLGEDGEDLLADARVNAARGEYEVALAQLGQFLEISPGDPEARYLQAYCHYRRGDGLRALEITLPMRRERLDDPDVRRGVHDLRAAVRDVLTPQETQIFLASRHRGARAADDRLRRFIEVAPEEAGPPFLLALTQAEDGDYMPAFRTARTAVEQADGDVRHLRALADALAGHVAGSLAGEAVQALGDGAYKRARAALAKVDRQWRETQTLRDLDTFLAELIRTNHSPARPLPPPDTPPDRTRRLHALIADTHRQEALDLIEARSWAAAERVLAKILHLVPAYPLPNLLYASCLLAQGKEPERAIAAAEIAVRDPALPGAEALLRVAGDMKEVLTINAAYKEHNDAVKKVGTPPTRQQLTVLRHSMEQLGARIPDLRATASTRLSSRRVHELGTAVARRLREVDEAIIEVEVDELVERFNRWAEGPMFDLLRPEILGRLDDGFAGPGDLITDQFAEQAAIGRDAQRLLTRNTDARTKAVLQEILAAVGRIR
jgi:tetratricopeptide (TPR) repeat protein